MAASTGQARVHAYQLAWSFATHRGSVRLWLTGTDEVIEKDLEPTDFMAMAALLAAEHGAEVAVGKDQVGSFIVAGRRNIDAK